jgi:hypothetical protein
MEVASTVPKTAQALRSPLEAANKADTPVNREEHNRRRARCGGDVNIPVLGI